MPLKDDIKGQAIGICQFNNAAFGSRCGETATGMAGRQIVTLYFNFAGKVAGRKNQLSKSVTKGSTNYSAV